MKLLIALLTLSLSLLLAACGNPKSGDVVPGPLTKEQYRKLEAFDTSVDKVLDAVAGVVDLPTGQMPGNKYYDIFKKYFADKSCVVEKQSQPASPTADEELKGKQAYKLSSLSFGGECHLKTSQDMSVDKAWDKAGPVFSEEKNKSATSVEWRATDEEKKLLQDELRLIEAVALKSSISGESKKELVAGDTLSYSKTKREVNGAAFVENYGTVKIAGKTDISTWSSTLEERSTVAGEAFLKVSFPDFEALFELRSEEGQFGSSRFRVFLNGRPYDGSLNLVHIFLGK